MFFYRYPFGYGKKTVEDIDKAILKDELEFPPNANEICSDDCLEFIKGVSNLVNSLKPLKLIYGSFFRKKHPSVLAVKDFTKVRKTLRDIPGSPI